MSLMQTLKDISAVVKTLVTAKDKSGILELVVSAREQAFALQEENSKLKKQIESFDRFDKEMENYSLVKLNGYRVYQHNADSDLHVCPRCVEEHRKIHHLQYISDIVYQCFSCEKFFQLHPDQTNYTKPVSIDSEV